MTADDPEKVYHHAERRLREVLLGDGTVTVGVVKGEERRLETTRLLRRMRDAFQVLANEREEGRAKAEAHAADLEEELRNLASTRPYGRPETNR